MKSGKAKISRWRGKGAGRVLAALVILACLIVSIREAGALDMSGRLSTQYRYRSTDHDSDQDLYQYLDLTLGDPYTAKVTASMFARGTADIDGRHDVDGHYVFDSITDAYESNINGRIYYAHLDFHRIKNLDRVTLGRQIMYETPVVIYFDGARVETAEAKEAGNLKLGLYGGMPVNLYETDPDNKEDALYGTFVQARPIRGGKLRLNWTHVDDKHLYGEDNDDFISLDLAQSLGDYLRLDGSYTFLEDQSRDWQGRAVYYHPGRDLMLQGSFYQLLETQKQESITFDPLYAPALEHHPYWQASLLASKGTGENFGVDAGADLRRLKDEEDRSDFNHGFERYFITLYVYDLVADGLEISATGEVWDSEDQVELIQTYGADVSYEASENLKTSAGTYYALYEYDYYLDREEEQARTYYARVRYHRRQGLGFGLSYEYEENRFDDFSVLKADIKCLF